MDRPLELELKVWILCLDPGLQEWEEIGGDEGVKWQ